MTSTLRDTLVGLGIALMVLFVVELSLRILYPEKVLQIAEDRRTINDLSFQTDPDYLIALKPGVSKMLPSGPDNGEIIHWQTNKDGFRGPELKTATRFRVIVYGDSNVQASFSRFEKTFPHRLEEYLAETSTDVEVINAGIEGFGPDQNLLRIKKEIGIYHPQIVILHVFADNDFGDIIRNRLFDVDTHGSLVRTRFATGVDPELQYKLPRLLLTRAVQKVFRWIHPTPNPQVFDESNATIEDRLSLDKQEYMVYREGRPKAFSVFADHYDTDLALKPESDSATAKVALMAAVLAKVKAVTDNASVAFLVVIEPSSRDLTRNREPNYVDFRHYPGYRPERLSSLVDNICARNGIHRVNLYPVFLKSDPSNLYFLNDDHWNDRGQDLAARKTAEYIRANFMTN
jgi:SGNH hydrolase-like domain, acetyltransferase AlgX